MTFKHFGFLFTMSSVFSISVTSAVAKITFCVIITPVLGFSISTCCVCYLAQTAVSCVSTVVGVCQFL